MVSWKIVNNDISFGDDGTLLLVYGKEEIKQNLEFELTTNLNEWVLNTEFGVDWINGKNGILDINYSNLTKVKIRHQILKLLEKRREVKKLKKIEYIINEEKRELRLLIDILSNHGDVNLDIKVGE